MTQVTHEQMLQNIQDKTGCTRGEAKHLTFGAFGGLTTRDFIRWRENCALVAYESALTHAGLSDVAAALVYVAASVLAALPACLLFGLTYGWFAGDCAFTLITLAVVLASAYLDGRP